MSQWIQYWGHVTVTRTHTAPRWQPANHQSHFLNRWEKEFSFKDCFIIHLFYQFCLFKPIYSRTWIAPYSGLLNKLLPIIHDGCKNIPSPVWLHTCCTVLQFMDFLCLKWILQPNGTHLNWDTTEPRRLEAGEYPGLQRDTCDLVSALPFLSPHPALSMQDNEMVFC